MAPWWGCSSEPVGGGLAGVRAGSPDGGYAAMAAGSPKHKATLPMRAGPQAEGMAPASRPCSGLRSATSLPSNDVHGELPRGTAATARKVLATADAWAWLGSVRWWVPQKALVRKCCNAESLVSPGPTTCLLSFLVADKLGGKGGERGAVWLESAKVVKLRLSIAPRLRLGRRRGRGRVRHGRTRGAVAGEGCQRQRRGGRAGADATGGRVRCGRTPGAAVRPGARSGVADVGCSGQRGAASGERGRRRGRRDVLAGSDAMTEGRGVRGGEDKVGS
ncbi:hypothetical protein SETIT_6G044200v2 [Setaria italica]|uniref:Uncharacterized protein n=1 Tax=Setaria italica TaxID=4555 RepID=A0A368RI60_SETIT|nr:hypothetical protein SETIT_6G044200v2 [Setaria italica]